MMKKEMTIGELALKKSYRSFRTLEDLIIEMEYDVTLEGDWAINNENLEQQMFNSFSEKEKQVFSLLHAKMYADLVLNTSVSDYERDFEDLYIDSEEFKK